MLLILISTIDTIAIINTHLCGFGLLKSTLRGNCADCFKTRAAIWDFEVNYKTNTNGDKIVKAEQNPH